jgi:hypothetical protein
VLLLQTVAQRELKRLGDTIVAHFGNRSPLQVGQAEDTLGGLAAALNTAANNMSRTIPSHPAKP